MTKTRKIFYWIATLWLSLGMLSSGIFQLLQMKAGLEVITHLGYPAYLGPILGVWKILGVAAILAPGFVLLKEWAYAGFFFFASGAAVSHLIAGHPFGEAFPGIFLLMLTVASWWLRPEGRRVAMATTSGAA
ncbi:DoxX-like protein [Roseimicrobium gellanilyticum]|uniref:DoxX-like protein n=1 Tax=Roseimicrobium gellanilyticum TaxID=748857 RepID=A0A366HE01_9BACT|nr:DoxX family protein [Roseimicrobium gellanilyticum]RBP40607.1 DoxX-like protein [Roseimicrobium gellanilyticum]